MSATKQIGDRVGPYVITGTLGSGGAGQVYLAAWQPDDEQREAAPSDHPPEVALKLLRADVALNEAVFNRFVREIGVAQQIHHPHILRHVDSGLVEDCLFYAMEVATLGSLRDAIRKRQALPWRDAVEGAIHIAAALGALHDKGLIHRDLKPDNVFLAEDGALKLGDFGLVLREDGERLTVAGQTVGSVKYMSPEQVRGERDLDGRTDLYALGCVITEMLAGRPPFVPADAMDAFRQHIEQPPPKLRTLAPTAPIALEYLVERLLAKEKADRPPTAQSVETVLRMIHSADDGEVSDLADSLVGTPAAIEPQPDTDEDDEPSERPEAASGSPAIDPDENDTEFELAAYRAESPNNLSQRLADGPPKAKGCMGALLLVAGAGGMLGVLLVL